MSAIYRYRAQAYWWNYRTHTHDPLEGLPTTDQQAVQYIPQDEDAQALYTRYRKAGDSIADAMAKVLNTRID